MRDDEPRPVWIVGDPEVWGELFRLKGHATMCVFIVVHIKSPRYRNYKISLLANPHLSDPCKFRSFSVNQMLVD